MTHPRTCEFPGCGRTHYANGQCLGHYRQMDAKGFLMPLAPAWRSGEGWTPEFAVQFATNLLAYHAPERLVPEFRPDPVPASSRGGERR